MLRTRVSLLLLCLMVCACAAGQQTPALQTSTPLPPETPTRTAVGTSTPSLEPAATLPASLSAGGPWVLILNQDGIWAANEDGAVLTRLTQDVVLYRTVAVSGRWVAYVTDVEAEPSPMSGGLTLKVLSLPEGEAQTVTGLQIPHVTSDSSEDLQFAALQVYRAVVSEGGGLAWSPDGTKLAFVSGHNGTSADVYVYSRDTGQITRLTDSPGNAYQLSWSPDGQYIFFTSASNFGTGAGYAMVGTWAARADGTGVRSLYELDPRSGSEVLVDWVSADTALVHSWRPDCSGLNLRRVNVASGEVQVVWPDYFNQVIYNPDTDTILIDANDISCNPEDKSGFYLSEPGGTELKQISEKEYHSRAPEQPPDPVPVTLRRYLETLLEVESAMWVQP